MWSKGNVHDRVVSLRKELDKVQTELDRDPSNNILKQEESVYLQSNNEAARNKVNFLKQK